MAPLVCLLLFLAMTGHSSATYCLCNDGVADQALQTTLDYACGNGADCSAIQQNGACYNPNTVKDHCNYAVNSYFQNKGQVTGSCDFAGTASVSANPPTNIPSTCTYPSSSTGTTPTTTPTTAGTPTSLGGGTGTAFSPTGTTTGINEPNHAVALFTSINNILFTFFITLWIVMQGCL
ncbi:PLASMODESMATA CALLOSE-BINDING PROTEIN 3 isoform X1 [Gossypium australe]|uniref:PLASMODESMATA CALLOSE-BINDING PROTEIN 3 isoform X1 n=1 Tax=Gossypium australe TaxID=47621 RepID=A0A5B6U928_9ROSI|nr:PLASMODESMATA CALLOSE-BINDING PROTEIN 3 isoform X1 [Gossypium australe]